MERLNKHHLVMHASAELMRKGMSRKKAMKQAWKNISPKKHK